MPAKRLSMRKIREILRLRFKCGQTNRKIAKSCLVSRSTVADYLLRASAAGLSWPMPEDLDESALDRLLFPPPETIPKARPAPNGRGTQRDYAATKRTPNRYCNHPYAVHSSQQNNSQHEIS